MKLRKRMTMKRTITIAIIALLLAACGGAKERAAEKGTGREADSMMAAYHYSDSLYANGRIDTAAFGEFIGRAVAFAEKHPADTLAPEMLFRAGVGSMILAKSAGNEVSRGKNAKNALEIFNRFQELYPDLRQARLCYWQRAIVYDDILGDWRSAESEYRDFITRFPDDSLTPVFQQYLTLLGKSETEIERDLSIPR